MIGARCPAARDGGFPIRPEATPQSSSVFFPDRSSLDSQLAQLLLQALAVEANLDSRSADVAVILLQAGCDVVHFKFSLRLFVRQIEKRARTHGGANSQGTCTSG